MPKHSARTAAPIFEHWDDLKNLDRKSLSDVWQRAFGRPIPAKLYKPMAVPLLAYRLQELRFGGLAPKAEQYLASLLPRPDSGRPRRAPRRCLQPGTRLLRTWQGRTHTVTVADPGYEYHGKTYGSLSVIARKITGTPWSGPAFFGLNEQQKKRMEASDEHEAPSGEVCDIHP